MLEFVIHQQLVHVVEKRHQNLTKKMKIYRISRQKQSIGKRRLEICKTVDVNKNLDLVSFKLKEIMR